MAAMNKADRDKVYERAGTRVLPLVFVDEEFIGGYSVV
jgi:glutaredoxin-related protein